MDKELIDPEGCDYMYQLTTKKSIGTMNLNWVNGTIECYQIGKGRFSLTPYRNFHLFNFWVVSEYEIKLPDNKIQLVTGPTLEILTAREDIPTTLTGLRLTTPSRKESKDNWDVIYRTGFYNQTHQDLNNSIIMVKQAANKLYDIHFSAKPSIDGDNYEVTGQCSIELSDSLERYW
jgi:hypothetical protein